MAKVQLQRDPYARQTLVRVTADDGECDYCGRQGRRWVYAWEDDSCRLTGRRQRLHAYCSVGCYRADNDH